MEERLQSARAVMFGALGVGSAIALPWIGWSLLALVFGQVTIYALLRPLIKTADRPEYPIAVAVVSAQVMISIAVALSGGPESPALLVYLLGVAGLPARFGTTRVVVAGVVLTEVLIFAATAAAHPSAFAADPSPVIIAATACFGLAAFAHALMRAESEQRSESEFDTLTGLPNRRSMVARFQELRAHAASTGEPVALLLCDLDLFKSINDVHGHHRGDEVLRGAADVISASLRASESVYRIGGEEFLVLLPGCDLERAVPVAERVRAAIEAAQPGGLPVTASVGAAAATASAIDFDALFERADSALYDAKRAGRNRVSLALA